MARIDWPALTHMKAAMAPSQTTFTRSIPLPLPFRRTMASGTASSATARPRPAQAAAIVPVPGLPVSFHTAARTIQPPSSGSPGSRLSTPITMFARISWSIRIRGMPPGPNATMIP